jgi:hypothetical protein
MNRRHFIRAGVVGSTVLAAGGAWMVMRDRSASSDTTSTASQRQRRIDRIVGAIAPVILAGALPADIASRGEAVKRLTSDIGSVIANFSAPVQHEVHELFSLLDIGIARRVLTGVSGDWPDADPIEIAAFLERWRRSSLETLQSGYHALHDLVLGAWYASPATWAAIGYAGPPKIR